MDSGSNGSLTFEPNMDSIGEVRVLTSNYQAEYGRNAGGGVMAITKSGTRDFHGSGYDFYRNETLNANDFFPIAPAPRGYPIATGLPATPWAVRFISRTNSTARRTSCFSSGRRSSPVSSKTSEPCLSTHPRPSSAPATSARAAT
jgi:hypothetical protein